MPDLKKMLTLEALSEALPSWLKRSTKPEYNADEIDSTLTTNQFVSASDKDNWNAKGTYSKPSGGIPKSDLSSIVQTSLEKADSALQSETDPTVPSWAKQTNKPSYTQDEVADGSTYKRVTQTEKDAWSGKQNALTTTQMQAVNSGITSEKVTQISTNQANVLLVANRTVKNLLDIIDSPSGTSQGVTYTNNGDQSYTVKGTSTGNDAYITLATFEAPFPEWLTAGTELGLRCSNENARLIVIPRINGTYGSSVYAGISDIASWTVPQNMDRLIVRFKVSDAGATVNDNNVRGMICYKSLGAIDSSLVPGAKPNDDLTRLESEDRAELVELVDNSDKNIFPIQTLVPYGPGLSNNSNLTCTNNGDGTYTLNGSTTAAGTIHLCDAMYSNTYGGYYMSGCPSDLNSASEEKARLALYTAVGSSGVAYETGNGVLIPSTFDQCYLAIYVFANKTYNNVIFKPMFCTKAKYIISPKYVPHVENKTYKGIEIVNSGSLNSVTESCFAAYSNNVTDGPVPNQWMFCRTTIVDAPSALQEVTTIGIAFESYIRVKSNSEWRAWKKITTT